MKMLLMAALAATPLAAFGQTPGSATGQQDIVSVATPSGCFEPPKPGNTEAAGSEPKARPGSGPISTTVTSGIDPDTIEAMYPEPMQVKPAQPPWGLVWGP